MFICLKLVFLAWIKLKAALSPFISVMHCSMPTPPSYYSFSFGERFTLANKVLSWQKQWKRKIVRLSPQLLAGLLVWYFLLTWPDRISILATQYEDLEDNLWPYSVQCNKTNWKASWVARLPNAYCNPRGLLRQDRMHYAYGQLGLPALIFSG